MRTLLRTVIQNATVTWADDSWPARLRVDAFVLHAAEMLAFERVEVVNLATGTSFTTWIEAAPAGSGEVRLHAGSETPLRRGDLISIASFIALHEGQTLAHTARFVTLDADNRVVEVLERGSGPE